MANRPTWVGSKTLDALDGRLEEDVWVAFQRAFHGWTGIRLSQSSVPTAIELLERRAAVAGESVATFVNGLDRFDRLHERRDIIDTLVVNTTWFMREKQGLEALSKALRDTAQRLPSPRPLRVWSAGCSTGQEPYGLAMLLEEAGLDFEVIATDISEAVLMRARHGEYSDSDMRAMPDGFVRYLERNRRGNYEVGDTLRQRVTFERHNLARPPHAPMKFRPLDAIVCRNVLIYFDRRLAVNIVDQFGAALSDDGAYVLLGAAEQPLVWLSKRLQPDLTYGGTLLKARDYGRPIEVTHGQLRTAEMPAITPSAALSTPSTSPVRSRRLEPSTRRAPKRKTPRRKPRETREPTPHLPARIPVEAQREVPAPPRQPIFPVEIQETLEAARRAQREGDHARGLELVDALLRRDQLIGEAHLLRGLMLKERKRTGAAIEALRNARFLTADDAWMASYQLGLMLEVSGDHPGAREAYRHALWVINAGGRSGIGDPEFDEDAFAATVQAACQARLASLRR